MSRAFRLVLPAAHFLVLQAVLAFDAAITSKDEEAVIHKIFRKLLNEAKTPAGLDWPPQLVLERTDRATTESVIVHTPEGKDRPRITVSTALLRIVKGDEDVLAFVLGCELAHFALGHHRLGSGGVVNEQRELQADVKAAELLLRAGYSLRKAARGLVRQKETPSTPPPSSLWKNDSLSWDDRFARLGSNPALWKTLPAFENGVLLPALEQYEAAEVCFTRAADEFPSCYEAWANLGIACLMQYCDGLTEEYLSEKDIGQLVCGSFYRRGPLVRVRGGEKLWWRAVGCLRETLRLKPELALSKAYLGLAYLLHPDGKDLDEAVRYFAEAAETAVEDHSLDPQTHAALLVNLGVARQAAGAKGSGLDNLQAALALGKLAPMIVAAVNYNRALVFAAGGERLEAVALFEKYLRAADPRSAWWSSAYDRYAELCHALGLTTRTKANFVKVVAERLRRTATVTLASGRTLAVGEAIEDVLERLGAHRTIVVLPQTNLKRYVFERHGIDVLATEEVVTVLLRNTKVTPVTIRHRCPNGEIVGELRVGMTRPQVESMWSGEDILGQGVYFYNRALGIAIRYDGSSLDARAVELVVAQTPEGGPLNR